MDRPGGPHHIEGILLAQPGKHPLAVWGTLQGEICYHLVPTYPPCSRAPCSVTTRGSYPVSRVIDQALDLAHPHPGLQLCTSATSTLHYQASIRLHCPASAMPRKQLRSVTTRPGCLASRELYRAWDQASSQLQTQCRETGSSATARVMHCAARLPQRAWHPARPLSRAPCVGPANSWLNPPFLGGALQVSLQRSQ